MAQTLILNILPIRVQEFSLNTIDHGKDLRVVKTLEANGAGTA